MKRDIVTISEPTTNREQSSLLELPRCEGGRQSQNGTVNVPANVQMRDFEIAELFGVMVPTVKGKIKTLLKNRHFNDCAYNVVSGSSLIPDYFDLEMVVAVAFSVDSCQADIFRKWLICKMIRNNTPSIYIGVNELKAKDNFFN